MIQCLKRQGCQILLSRRKKMVINHNISAIFAQRQEKINAQEMDSSMQKLSSGLRINRGADDPAGLALSEKMRAQIRGLKQAERNGEDGISFIQTTEGYLENTQNVLHRLREIAVQAANGIYTNEDRMQIQVEVSQLIDEVDRIASHAQFNGLNMLTGLFATEGPDNYVPASMWFHIGANMDQRERVFIGTMTAAALGIKEFSTGEIITFSSPNDANRGIGIIDNALSKVSKQRADLGAYQNRLEFAVKGIMIGQENLQASESRIRDTNMAEQFTEFSTERILQQTAVAMLAHANMRPQSVMKLIQ